MQLVQKNNPYKKSTICESGRVGEGEHWDVER